MQSVQSLNNILRRHQCRFSHGASFQKDTIKCDQFFFFFAFPFYRGEDIKQSSRYKLPNGETVSQSPYTNVHMKGAGLKPGESISCRRPLVDHPS